jgi:hypothetical protein
MLTISKSVLFMSMLIMALSPVSLQAENEAVGLDDLSLSALAAQAESLRDQGLAGKGQAYKNLLLEVADRYRIARNDRSTDWSEWIRLGEAVGRDLPGDLRGDLAETLKARLAGDAAQIAAMSPKRVTGLCEAIFALGRRDVTGEISTTWILGSDAYKQADPHVLYRLSFHIRKGGQPTGPARARLVEHVDAKYLSTAEKAKAFGPLNCHLITIHILFGVDGPMRNRWASSIRQAFAGSDDEIRSLSVTRVRWVSGAIDRLDPDAAEAIVEVWMEQDEVGISELTKRDLTWLARRAGQTRDRHAALRERIIEYVSRTWLSGETSPGALSPTQWHAVLSGVSGELSEPQRNQWRRKIKDYYLSNLPAFLGQSPHEIRAALEGIRLLGNDRFGLQCLAALNRSDIEPQAETLWILSRRWGKDRAAYARELIRYFSGRPNRLDSVDAGPLTGLFRVMVHASDASWIGPLMKHTSWTNWQGPKFQALAVLASVSKGQFAQKYLEEVESRYWSDRQAVAQTDLQIHADQAAGLRRVLTETQKKQWAGQLRSVYAPGSKRVGAIGAEEIRQLTRALKALGDRNVARYLGQLVLARSEQ